MSSNCIRASLNQAVQSVGFLPIITISDEDKARIIITNSNSGNVVLVRARIVGQEDWDTIATITGNSKQVVNVSTYDEIQMECTVFDSVSSYIKVVLGSFNEAGGSTSIGASAGGTVSGSELTFVSSDGSIDIIADPLTDTINFKATGVVGGVKYVKTVVLGDWVGPSLGEYTLSIPFTFHGKTNPVVTCLESVSGEFQVVEVPVILTGNDVRIMVLSTPDTRFVGKIFVD